MTDGSTTTTPRERAIEAYEAARDNVSTAGRKAKDSLTDAPLIALAGGIAAGALIAALLPRTKRETEFIRPTARRVKDTARAAFDAAKDAGSSSLNDAGITRSQGQQTLQSLIQGVGEAVRASAEAALGAARNSKD